MVLQWISTVADVLGVTMDGITFVDRIVKNGKENGDPLKLLCIMREPTAAWKRVHLDYCALRPSLERVSNCIHNGKGVIKTKVNAHELQIAFQDKGLYRAVLDHERKLSVSMAHIELSFKAPDVIKKINAIDNERIRTALEQIKSEKEQVEQLHKSMCSFFRNVSNIIDKPRWDDSDVSLIIEGRRIYTNDCVAVVDSTDVIVMKLLEIYEVAFNALSQ